MLPPNAQAASLVPSAELVIPLQFLGPPVLVISIHDLPESEEIQMLPPVTTAACLTPSLDELTDLQLCTVIDSS